MSCISLFASFAAFDPRVACGPPSSPPGLVR